MALEVAIQEIWLMKQGGELDSDTVVLIRREDLWYEVARERAGANFSHHITANGILTKDKPADWLNTEVEEERQ